MSDPVTGQIDRPALTRRAGHILFTQGPEQPAATARETVILLDALTAAEARIRDLAQEVRDERGAALDALEQIKIRDRRIKAVQEVLDRHGVASGAQIPARRIRRALDN